MSSSICENNNISSFGLPQGHEESTDHPSVQGSKIGLEDRLDVLEQENDQLWSIIEILQRDLADHGKRLKVLESIPIKTTKKTETRLIKLERLLISRGNEPISFSEIGKLLELGSRDGKKTTRRQNMTHFRKILEAHKERYEIRESKTKGGKLVRLSRDYFIHAMRV